MWAVRAAHRARIALADVSPSIGNVAGPSRQCFRRWTGSVVEATPDRTFLALRPGRRSPYPRASLYSQRSASTSSQSTHAQDEVFVTNSERAQALLLASAKKKVEEYRLAEKEFGEIATVEEQKARAKLIKHLAPLAEAYDRYCEIRKLAVSTMSIDPEALLDIQRSELDPDPDMQEMFEAERENLAAELDDLLYEGLPRLLLPPLDEAPLATMMHITAGIGGGEASRFAEELSRMYIKHGESKGWKSEVLSAVEGAMAKGFKANGFRELIIKFTLADWVEEGTECFGDLMWEGGTHRVQRVPPGATVDKMHSSTVNVSVSPIYNDTPEEPLVDPKDVREDAMRARGAGGQHVNKTESAIRLVHIPTGITVSMQDSRSQGTNRVWAWEVLRARLSEKRRADEQEARNARRVNQIRGSFRGDKVRTYNYPQDRVTDHRIGWSTTGLDLVMSGEGFSKVVDAMKADLTARRLENLLEGSEEDIME